MLLSVSEIILRLFCQGYNFLRPAAQKHSIFGENDPMPVPMEQCDAKLLFQLDELSGQGGLGQVQQSGRLCDVFFSGRHQKVFQNTNFHKKALPSIEKECHSIR